MSEEQRVLLKVRDWKVGESQSDPKPVTLSPDVLHYFARFVRDILAEQGQEPGIIRLAVKCEAIRFVGDSADFPAPTPKEPGHE